MRLPSGYKVRKGDYVNDLIQRYAEGHITQEQFEAELRMYAPEKFNEGETQYGTTQKPRHR